MSFDFWRWWRWRSHRLIWTGWNDWCTKYNIDRITHIRWWCGGCSLNGWQFFICITWKILHIIGIFGDWNNWSTLWWSSTHSNNTTTTGNDTFWLHDYLSIQSVHLKLNHFHALNIQPKNNNNNHWKSCECRINSITLNRASTFDVLLFFRLTFFDRKNLIRKIWIAYHWSCGTTTTAAITTVAWTRCHQINILFDNMNTLLWRLLWLRWGKNRRLLLHRCWI